MEIVFLFLRVVNHVLRGKKEFGISLLYSLSVVLMISFAFRCWNTKA